MGTMFEKGQTKRYSRVAAFSEGKEVSEDGKKRKRTVGRKKPDEQLALEADNRELLSEDVRNRFRDIPGSLKDAGERIMRELKPTIDEVVQSRPAMKKGGKVESKKMIAHEKAEMKATRMAVGGRARPARARSPEERRNIRRQVAINRMRRASAPERAAPKNRRMPSPTELRNMTPAQRQRVIRSAQNASRNPPTQRPSIRGALGNMSPEQRRAVRRTTRKTRPMPRPSDPRTSGSKTRPMPRPRPGNTRPGNPRPGTRPIPNNRGALLRGNLNSRPNRIPNPKARTMRNAPPELRQQLRRAQRTKNRNMPRPGTPRPNTPGRTPFMQNLMRNASPEQRRRLMEMTRNRAGGNTRPRPGTPRPRPNNSRDPRTGNGSIAGLREGARPKNRQMPRPGARPTNPRRNIPKNQQMPRPGARPTNPRRNIPKNRQMPRPGRNIPKNRQMPRPGTPRPTNPRPPINPRTGRSGLGLQGMFQRAGMRPRPGMKAGGVAKTKKYAGGGMIPTASKKSPNSMGTSYSAGGRIKGKGKAVDGCATKGKTRGRTV